jgi:hypothetical protein
MTARQLLQLYPRAWRERYGEEFVETVGARPLNTQQTIDIVGGAIDAWFTSTPAATTLQTPGGGAVMTQRWKAICATNGVRYTKRDALISAGVMIAASLSTLILVIATWIATKI